MLFDIAVQQFLKGRREKDHAGLIFAIHRRPPFFDRLYSDKLQFADADPGAANRLYDRTDPGISGRFGGFHQPAILFLI